MGLGEGSVIPTRVKKAVTFKYGAWRALKECGTLGIRVSNAMQCIFTFLAFPSFCFFTLTNSTFVFYIFKTLPSHLPVFPDNLRGQWHLSWFTQGQG